MATEVDRLFPHIDRPLEANGTCVSPCPARGNAPALVIATRNEIVAVGIEALLQADGYRVVARCSSEDDLLRSSEACRPDIIVLAENFVRQEATKIVLRLRAHNRSVAIVVLLEERDAIKPADLLELDVKGILLSVTSRHALLDCVESVHHGLNGSTPTCCCAI